MISCQNITCGYGKTPILQDFSLDFTPQKFTALIGENGCGKSTLLKSIMGFLPLTTGDITITSPNSPQNSPQNLHDLPPRQRAKLVAYLPQHTHCPDYLTVAELVQLGRYAYGGGLFGRVSQDDTQRFMHALEQVGLIDRAGEQVNALSGGQRQRAWIAMILAQDSDVILLDEPVNHLDVRYQYSVLALVREIMAKTNKTIIAVLHDLNQASVFADEICLLKQGKKIAHGTAPDVMNTHNIKAGFDFDGDFVPVGGRVFCVPDVSDYAQHLPQTPTPKKQAKTK